MYMMSKKSIDVMIKQLNFDEDGVIKLPPGFRFQPTEEELVFQYLKCKVFTCPLPASIIPEINVFKYNPWDLPGDVEGEKFFFCKKEVKYHNNGKRINRSTDSGYWKTTGSEKQIMSAIFNSIIGIKKTLVFYKGDPHSGSSKTGWLMHEYRLAYQATAAPCNSQLSENSTSTWVLCRVSLRKTKTGSASADNYLENGDDNFNNNNSNNFSDAGVSSCCISSPSSAYSSSSSSSVITKVSVCGGSDNDETEGDSSYTSYYYFERDGR